MARFGIGRFLGQSRPVESIQPPSASPVSCSVALAGMRHSYAVFSMAWQKHEAKRDCPAMILGGILTPFQSTLTNHPRFT